MLSSRFVVAAAGIAGAFLAVEPALALVVPFTEHFALDAAGWRQRDGLTALTSVAAGGPDGSSFARAAFSFANINAGEQVTLFRGEDTFASSSGNLFGNYLAGQVATLSFAVRHNASAPLSFFSRIARSTTNPGGTTGVAAVFAAVQPGEWTTLTLPIVFNPALFYEGPPSLGFHNAIFGAVARIQIGVFDVPGSLALATPSFNFDIDQVRVVPAPGAVAAMLGLSFLAARRRR